MNFDEIYDRVATRSSKWTLMASGFGITDAETLPMWVADMDFRAPSFLSDAVREVAEAGDFGYFAHTDTYREAAAWWSKTRHGWEISPDRIINTASLGNAIAFAIQTWSTPGDAVAIFTPVYHEFAMKIRKNGRTVTELPLVAADGRFTLDFDACEARMTGRETMLLLASPHNPGGRVWTVDELRAIADFAARHDLVLVSDEIHNDIVMPGFTHVPTALAAPDARSRLVTMTSASKTFSIAGTRLGAVIIEDDRLHRQYANIVNRADLYPNLFGVVLSRAAYSPEGAAWVDQLVGYLAENNALFHERISAIPGTLVHELQGTYLAWVDFSRLGMTDEELWRRVTQKARVLPSPGPNFGTGGEGGLRFNLGTQRARVEEAADRLVAAFADLQ
ncbi:MalY/PatB family protein [Sinisalibacter aestuarii]|uniref:Aminotransferase n=1 Tax=Sinisalibacter aestuarii TaxID=2949426 RepID=A0ABQ5LPK4_9RHOB|nr:PatB family C-S lyase [Sinisalibacter aestuarii]GKY86925.1 aminotransferase [Sinisalibacter aestuarii]